MNFALLVSNLPDIHQIRHASHASHVPVAPTPTALKRMLSHLLTRLQHN